MKKYGRFLTFALALALLSIPLAGCSAGEGNMRVMLDSNVFVGDFSDIDEAIESYEMSLDNGTEPDTVYNRKKVENTQLLKAFAEEKGVSLEAQALGWGEPLTRSLLNCFLVGDGPDLVIGETQLPTFAKQGYLRPFPDELEQFIRDNCSPLAYRAMEWNGDIYGIGLCPGVAVLAWNKEILIDAGYSETDPIVTDGPSTWDEWKEAMERVYSPSDRIYAGGVYAGGNTGGYMRVGALMDSAGGSYDNAEGLPAINTQPNSEAFEFVR